MSAEPIMLWRARAIHAPTGARTIRCSMRSLKTMSMIAERTLASGFALKCAQYHRPIDGRPSKWCDEVLNALSGMQLAWVCRVATRIFCAAITIMDANEDADSRCRDAMGAL
jgi:predicted oxidoreductase